MHKKGGLFQRPTLYRVCAHVSRVLVACLIKFCIHHSSSLSVSLPPLSEAQEGLRWHRGEESKKVGLGSHTGGVFRVSWHLGERFQLVRDPCVHFDGFAGE